MKFRCCAIGISWLVALGVICHGHDHRVDASPRPSSKASKFISKIHSLTVADVNGTTLTVRQVSMNGADLDRFTITK